MGVLWPQLSKVFKTCALGPPRPLSPSVPAVAGCQLHWVIVRMKSYSDLWLATLHSCFQPASLTPGSPPPRSPTKASAEPCHWPALDVQTGSCVTALDAGSTGPDGEVRDVSGATGVGGSETVFTACGVSGSPIRRRAAIQCFRKTESAPFGPVARTITHSLASHEIQWCGYGHNYRSVDTGKALTGLIPAAEEWTNVSVFPAHSSSLPDLIPETTTSVYLVNK